MGGEEKFHEFVATRRAALLRTACLLSGDWASAEDLVQTTLTKTYLAWERIKDHDAADAYVRKIMVNTATSWWRRRWRGEQPTEVLPEIVQPDFAECSALSQDLWAEVRKLPARQRAVVVLRFHDDLSEAATAAALGVTVGTVKSQTSRAISALRDRVQPAATEGSVTR
ncbi:RNA polymerase sigma-70 factor, sigma-E family [Actinokineospora alba]|uniref:RNA polymerase sigma-70 factor, sigma-E family n=1 Tax=Actinokineospora alba TaxID=504798 RepID=A0A1H0QWH7_9PSEU|nr:SigE family RNA polymerase sigma factor [Actinokineospora alba]TDP70361.1 RNA polymerase sigma-70 factor (sigma-E family) [Actinokineospora alba]SDI33304.1 RNA polymerase sigma-70 factor, sigma-E family [Actinokineospora alba]SDP21661.1 RNA polymerase sigma-70 factor, sigma-E family [Actinokineospora alba]